MVVVKFREEDVIVRGYLDLRVVVNVFVFGWDNREGE